ncbi:MAG: small multi-drug export protein [Fuerstiella sp.]
MTNGMNSMEGTPDPTGREPVAASAAAEADDDQLVSGFEQDSTSLWRDDRLLAMLTLAGPVLATVAIVVSIAVIQGTDAARRLVLTALLAFFVLGRFVILGGRDVGAETVGFTPGQLALMVFYMDIMTAIVISWHAGVLFRLPWLGTRLRFLMQSGRDVLAENRWMRRTTLLAIVAFVMFPLASSGSVGGSLFGRLLGLTRVSAFFGVLAGSLLGCGTMYYGATIINRYVDEHNPLLRWGGVAAIVVLLAVLNRRYRKAATPASISEKVSRVR